MASIEELRKEIIKYDGFPNKISYSEIVKNFLIRAIPEKDVYESGDVADFMEFIIAPQKEPKAVLSLSMFLYGYYQDKHLEIWKRIKNLKSVYPLYLKASELQKTLPPNSQWEFEDRKNKMYKCNLTCEHNPCLNKDEYENYWHFNLVSQFIELPDDKIDPLTNSKKNKCGNDILGYIIENAVLYPQKETPIPYENISITKILKDALSQD